MIWILIIIVVLVAVVFVTDFVAEFYIWQSRIKIGRFTSDKDWITKVSTTAQKWLFNTPTAKLTDNSRLILIDMLKGNYRRSTIQVWQKAALLIGLTDYASANNDQNVKALVNRFVTTLFESDGNWKQKPTETDWVMMSYAVIRIPWMDSSVYKPAFDDAYQLLLGLKGSDGLVSYKKHTMDYRFVDTLGFICPFLTAYGVKFSVAEAVDLACNQIEGFHQFGLMPTEHLPCHTYSVSTKLPVGLYGWGRGLGWYAIGLGDTYNELPEEHPYKSKLKVALQQFSESVVRFQTSEGAWRWLIFDTNARNDSSATAVLNWFLNTLPDSLQTEATRKASQQAKSYLQRVTRRDGGIDFSQGDTKGIGLYALTFEILPFTQGFALRAQSKISAL